jgi:hypothetical protein
MNALNELAASRSRTPLTAWKLCLRIPRNQHARKR